MPGTFSPPLRVNDPDMHYGTCVTHVPWCMPGSLTSGFLWIRWRGKHSRHSRCMRNLQFYASDKRPVDASIKNVFIWFWATLYKGWTPLTHYSLIIVFNVYRVLHKSKVDTRRNNNVIITSKRRRFDVMMTLLRRVSVWEGVEVLFLECMFSRNTAVVHVA